MSLFPDLAPPAKEPPRPWLREGYTGDALIVGPHRYWLSRSWDTRPTMAVLGINPSKAAALDEHDQLIEDPTVWRCCDFADLSGHGALFMLNPFAYRATDVRELRTAKDPIGPDNDRHIRALCARARTVVIGWGPPTKIPAALRPRLVAVETMLRAAGVPLHVLRLTAGGHPEHPLMLPRECRPVLWRARA